MGRRRTALLIILILCTATAFSAGLSGITPRLGVIFEPAPENLVGSDGFPAAGPPLLTYFLGFGATLELGGLFSWEPALDFYYGYYLWSAENNRALNTELSWRTSFTMAFLVGSPFVFTLPVARDWDLALGVGPAFNLRASILASMSAADKLSAEPDIPKINGYFWSQGRWFMPETFFRVSYNLTQRVDFSFSAIAFWPLANLWINPVLPLDEGIFGGELRVKALLD